MKKEVKEFKKTSNVLAFLDVLLAVLIIIFSQRIIGTQLGQAILVFGLVMVFMTTTLLVFKEFR